MKNALLNCYYDGKTVDEAVEFIKSCYGEQPTDRQIAKVKQIIKTQMNKEW